jgi:hypothetical protein
METAGCEEARSSSPDSEDQSFTRLYWKQQVPLAWPTTADHRSIGSEGDIAGGQEEGSAAELEYCIIE